MKSIFTFLMLILSFGLAPSQASAYNPDDPKFQSEMARRSDPRNMNAQTLSHSIICTTGACFKKADTKLGFDLTPDILPDGDPKNPGRQQPGDVVQ